MASIDIGTVRGSQIDKNKDGDDSRRLLQVELSNADDLQTIEQLGPPGDDSAPHPDARALVLSIGPSYKVCVGLDDSVTPTALAGTKIIYSHDDTGARVATITLDVGGEITIDNSACSVVIDVDGAFTMTNASGKGLVTLDKDGNFDVNGFLTVTKKP